MNRKTVYQVILPLLTAFIWGSAFVSQSIASGELGTFSFNMARGVVASVELLAVALLRRRFRMDTRTAPEKREARRTLLLGGTVCGVLLMVSSNLQQYGIESKTSSGKAGFITALYIVLVPVLGLLLRRRVRPLIWLAVAIALGGLYCLCFEPGASLRFTDGDLYVFLGSIGFAVHILAVDHFVKRLDGIELSCVQFIVTVPLNLVFMLALEHPAAAAFHAALPHILYVGVLSSGVAYTLQIVAQRYGDPTVVSLLLSLESFFAVVSGAIVLQERLAPREYFGCALMLCAVVLAQLPERNRKAAAEGNG